MEKKKIVALLCVLGLLVGTIGSPEAMASQEKGSPAVFATSKKISLSVGKSKKIRLKKAPGVKIKAKKFISKNKKIAAVTKKGGKVKAKTVGTTAIRIRVKYVKNKKIRKTTLKCKVIVSKKKEKSDKTATQTPAGGQDSDRNKDSDGDGITDLEEKAYGSDPYISDDTEKDSDNDGLSDYMERFATHTDMYEADTDSDKISDYDETCLTYTDPLTADTDGDGIDDYSSDEDGDGLYNGTEMSIGTDPCVSDTDGDGLTDREEYRRYKTSPLRADSDGDGADDGWEIANGYDPLEAEDEFHVEKEAVSEDGTTSVSVELDYSGNPAEMCIEEMPRTGLLDSSVPGYICNAFDFTASEKIDAATITFTYNPQKLAANARPTIYYLNEDTQLLEEQDTVLSGRTASARVTHFSTYILLDKNAVDKAWDNVITEPDEASVEGAALDIAFVIDYSASMDDNDPDYLRLDIVNGFISKLRNQKDRASIIEFAAYATTLVSLTSDKEALARAVGRIENASDSEYDEEAGTNGTDGLNSAIDQLKGSQDTKKCVIFLTDGEDTTFSYDYADLMEDAAAHDITIYSIGMGGADADLLASIAESTGGKYYFASAVDLDDTSEGSLMYAFSEIENDTLGRERDSNDDGISDYYTQLMCEGKLCTGTGKNIFGDLSFEEVQRSPDYDGDGLENGEEVIVSYEKEERKIYLKMASSSVEADTDSDVWNDSEDEDPLEWNVGDRDLAIFAALAYEDGKNFTGKMYQSSDIRGSQKKDGEHGEKYYFLNGASISRKGTDSGIADQWTIVDYVLTKEGAGTHFSATTFKNGKNIVIAYRGTDGELGEWLNNILGVGVLNFHAEESAAVNYALKIADKYPDSKLYITGHSLGGYLSQIGASALLRQRKADLAGVVYFNGIGLAYNPLLRKRKKKDLEALSDYARNHKLISYEICGDVVSALGIHSGEEISYYACDEARKNHAGKHGVLTGSSVISKDLTGWMSLMTGDNLVKYYDYYKPKSLVEYFWITHETDSFFYELSQGERHC